MLLSSANFVIKQCTNLKKNQQVLQDLRATSQSIFSGTKVRTPTDLLFL